MVRAALHVPDTVAPELLLEPRLTPPGRVLAPLVGQNLARRAIVGDCPRQRLQHKRAPLVMRHHQAHEIARMVIQERRHVHPLMTPEQERKEIRLPELIGLGALKAPLLRLGPRACRRPPLGEPLLPQHPAHRRVGSANAEEAPHHVANAPAPSLRLGLLRRNHRISPRVALRLALTHRDARFGAFGAHARALWISARPAAATPGRLLKRRAPTQAIPLHPRRHGRARNAQLLRHTLRRDPLVNDHRGRRNHHVARPSAAGFPATLVFAPLRRRIRFRLHSYSPFGLPRQPKSEASARWFLGHATAHLLVRGTAKAGAVRSSFLTASIQFLTATRRCSLPSRRGCA